MFEKKLDPLRLTGQVLDKQPFSCTGKQLAVLLHAMSPWVRTGKWYIFDVSTNSRTLEFLKTKEEIREAVTLEELTSASIHVEQFLSGVFIAVPTNAKYPDGRPNFLTEDDPPNHIGNAIVEIRAFDTSYFEVYSESLGLMSHLRATFGGMD